MKNNIFKNRFIELVSKIFIIITIILLVSFILKNIIDILDFQWIYNINTDLYYKLMGYYYSFYYNGVGYLITSILIVVISLIVIYFDIKKTSIYVDNIYNSIDKLFDEKNDYISLPGDMKDFEIKINHFRNESIKNKKLALENEKRKDELIVYLAHDIKTPLTVVIGYLSLLNEIDDMPSSQRKKYLELVLNKSYRLEELINELFEIARFNSEKIILEKEELNINLMIEQIIDDFYPILTKLNKKVNFKTINNLKIYADTDKLSRVFNNLIKNAINYSKDNTDIDIKIKRIKKEIIIDITNQGKMIPKDKLDKIFENFYRVDPSRTSKTGGSGLGLAISKEIIKLHNGKIEVSSNKDKTTFTITLPIE